MQKSLRIIWEDFKQRQVQLHFAMLMQSQLMRFSVINGMEMTQRRIYMMNTFLPYSLKVIKNTLHFKEKMETSFDGLSPTQRKKQLWLLQAQEMIGTMSFGAMTHPEQDVNQLQYLYLQSCSDSITLLCLSCIKVNFSSFIIRKMPFQAKQLTSTILYHLQR